MSLVRVCALADVPADEGLAVHADGFDLVIARQGEEVFALEDECSHAAVALSEGMVDKGCIECWLHGSRFDLRTGKPTGPPATEPVETYPVRVEDGDVLVDLPG